MPGRCGFCIETTDGVKLIGSNGPSVPITAAVNRQRVAVGAAG